MYLKRTLVLSGENNNKGILSLEKANKPTAHFKIDEGEYAVFQFNDAPMELYPLQKSENELICELPQYIDLSGNISCAIIGYQSVAKIMMIGATKDKEAFRAEVQKNIEHFTSQIKSLKSDDVVIESSSPEISSSNTEITEEVANLFEEDKNDIDDAITDSLIYECLQKDSKCEECVYKKAFFDAKEESQEQPIDGTEEDKESTFFDQVKSSIENLFETYPVNQELVDAIENSQFVKVDYEGDGNFYSVGLIFDDDDLKYICYAIPSEEGVEPPKELQEFSQWLKIRDGYGYWMTYQDGKTGESVTFN